jgi:hypothetical protein
MHYPHQFQVPTPLLQWIRSSFPYMQHRSYCDEAQLIRDGLVLSNVIVSLKPCPIGGMDEDCPITPDTEEIGRAWMMLGGSLTETPCERPCRNDLPAALLLWMFRGLCHNSVALWIVRLKQIRGRMLGTLQGWCTQVSIVKMGGLLQTAVYVSPVCVHESSSRAVGPGIVSSFGGWGAIFGVFWLWEGLWGKSMYLKLS